ncbi:MAG: signal recognition particle-docking protein FtsY [Proteobacteria bacterium]|nr:signal recognition particle-docking protein FtsY [Pseudomonadota bacterium]MDA0966288.1 signal recognition particle-docking protein FtsY [Pseudomonadota bacterium]
MFGFGKKKKKEKKDINPEAVNAQEDQPSDPIPSESPITENNDTANEPEQVTIAQTQIEEPLIAEPSKTPPQSEEAEQKGWLKRLKQGLNKSSSKLNDGIKDIFVRKKLDDDTLQDLEDLLITSDMGVQTASYITSKIAKDKFDKEVTTEEIKQDLAKYIARIIEPVAKPIQLTGKKPQVILMCGVNGTGKTTTIGKIANNYKKEGKKVVIAACDTFRAAAVEQLEVWSERSGCPLIKGKEGADPASVAYEAFVKAKEENADILMIDTAGRLQNKKNLMEQLTKIIKVIKKLDEEAPHNSIIVLDATTGQNANSQVKVFGEMVNLNGIIVTKLDGTAKGGVVVSLAKQFALPIHAIGVGESIEDLKPFNAESFANSLVGID